jgi:hypothetical protein
VESGTNQISKFSLPNFIKIYSFGKTILKNPEKITIQDDLLYVTDNDPKNKIKVFRIDDKKIKLVRSFGKDIKKPKDIKIDPFHQSISIIDEFTKSIMVYSYEGVFLKSIGNGVFRNSPNSFVLISCPNSDHENEKDGYWIVSEKNPKTKFHLFYRDFKYIGCFHGSFTSFTEVITFSQKEIGSFHCGALYSSGSDIAFSAFSFFNIAKKFKISPYCLKIEQ